MSRLALLDALLRALAVLAVAVVALIGGASSAAPASAAAPTAVTAMAAPSTTHASVLTAPAAPSVLTAPAAPSVLAAPAAPSVPQAPTPAKPQDAGSSVRIDLGNVTGSKPSTPIVVIIGLTLLAVAPALLLLTTSFTKMIVVLSLTRNALGLQSIPPNQVLAGLALFLSLFVMGPVLTKVNDQGVQPYLAGDKKQAQAFADGSAPLKGFMLDHTRKDELALMTKLSEAKKPTSRSDVGLTTLIPAFVLSELKSAFIIGFVIFVPFLVIDIIVSASLMSMGMMMLPPVMISLPFKLLLFVMVDGWGLIVTSLVTSYR